jgi:hypothetical protein
VASIVQATVAGPPARYPHQEEMLRVIHHHISREESSHIDNSLPLQIELCTPSRPPVLLSSLLRSAFHSYSTQAHIRMGGVYLAQRQFYKKR